MGHVHHEAESKVRANGIEIAYDSFGGHEAPPLILIMGFTMPMIAWDEEFCGMLAGRGFRVIRFDNRDIGHSSWLTEAGIPDIFKIGEAAKRGKPAEVPYRLEDMAGDVIGLMDVLGIESANVMGMSMGGMIAQIAALRRPARVRTLISLSSTMWSLDPSLPNPTPEALEVLTKPVAMDRDGFIEDSVKAWKVIGGAAMPIDEAFLRERARRIFERGVSLPGLARQMTAIMTAGSRREALRSATVPTLVLHGDADPLIPCEHGIATADTIPGAKLHLIKGMGHDLPPRAWQEITDAIAGNAR